MGLRRTKEPKGLTEELIHRTWDLDGRIKQLEDRFEAQLDELSKRYRRAEQSEARFDRKAVDRDCDDGSGDSGDDVGDLAIQALKRRQNAPPARLDPLAG